MPYTYTLKVRSRPFHTFPILTNTNVQEMLRKCFRRGVGVHGDACVIDCRWVRCASTTPQSGKAICTLTGVLETRKIITGVWGEGQAQ